MAPRSLFDMAKISTIRNITLLEDIGTLPYHFMRPILLKLENPNQLRVIEKNCPQLLGEDGEIWLKFIKRDIPNWEKKPHEPKNPELWYKVYLKLLKERDQETAEAEEALKMRMAELHAKRVANTLTAPTMMIPERMQKKKQSTTFSKVADKSQLRFTGGSKTKNVMDRVKREANEAKLRKNGRLTTPSHLLASGIVRQAPQGMIDSHRQEANRPPAMRAPVRPATAPTPAKPSPKAATSSSALVDREARLKALQSGTSSKPSSSAHTSLDPSTNYKAPPLGRTNSPTPRMTSALRKPSPPLKRKREADVFMQTKKR
ncbi:hypothetical protein EJ08DRAFT_651889 [Tothia fuscella]|uniref:Elongin-A n=1 Tax=Tothia fuscella TaxID=1048955 RepID=A0A9P4NLE3_9PEZI|nr:hypothetical protein EJ08DRAFT_651889 [Tothia fuscella]